MLHGGLPDDEIIAFADSLAAEAQRIGGARGHAFAHTLRRSKSSRCRRAWHAAVEEARGWDARAFGRPGDAGEDFRKTAEGFCTWGQPLGAQRCTELATT